jgi:hypothetical protein
MGILNIIKGLATKAKKSEKSEVRSIVMMQRKAHSFTQEELLIAGERGWGKKFDGKEDPMYFVSAGPPLTIFKAGPHLIHVTSIPTRYADDDEYALSSLPQPEQKEAWTEHHACTSLDFFNDYQSGTRIPNEEAYASLAKLALQLGDPNCTAIYLPTKNIMMPNSDGSAEEGLRLLINKLLPG